MKEIFSRLKAESPLFFKRVRNVGLSLSAAGTSIVIINGIPDTVKHYGEQAIWMGAVMAVIASMTCQDPKDLKK